jgi:acyl carrier protein
MVKSVASILEKILELKPNSLRADSDLRALSLDSMDTINLIAGIDDVFGVTIAPEQLNECRSVENLETWIRNARRPGSAAA